MKRSAEEIRDSIDNQTEDIPYLVVSDLYDKHLYYKGYNGQHTLGIKVGNCIWKYSDEALCAMHSLDRFFEQ